MKKIGFATSDFYNLGFLEQLKICSNVGENAIELHFSYKDLIKFKLTNEINNLLKKFSFISIHVPCKGLVYGKNEKTDKVFEKVREISKSLSIKAVVFHPNAINDFSALEKSGLPILLENMDKDKKEFTKPEDFQKLKKKYGFGFVFDSQHAYEADPSMKLAKKLIKVMGNRLEEMHISGHGGVWKHLPVYSSKNKEAIEKILKLKLDVPIILEGCFSENIEEAAKKELEFVRGFY